MQMNTQIRKDVPLALYYQLKEELRRKIMSNEWKDGARLPSEKEMCTTFGVSRATVRRAVADLETDGYLEKKQGRGTFVKKRSVTQKLHKFYTFREELKKLGIKETSKLVTFRRIVPEVSIREALRLKEGEEVFWVKRVRYMDNEAYTVENSYIPVEFAPEMTDELIRTNGLYKTLQLFQVFPERAIESFSAVSLKENDSQLLGVEAGEAAIYLTRITYSGINIIEYCQSVVRGDVFQYTVELS